MGGREYWETGCRGVDRGRFCVSCGFNFPWMRGRRGLPESSRGFDCDVLSDSCAILMGRARILLRVHGVVVMKKRVYSYRVIERKILGRPGKKVSTAVEGRSKSQKLESGQQHLSRNRASSERVNKQITHKYPSHPRVLVTI